jgi:hypothetical protein
MNQQIIDELIESLGPDVSYSEIVEYLVQCGVKHTDAIEIATNQGLEQQK